MDTPLLLDYKSLDEIQKQVTGTKLEKIIIPKLEQQPVFQAAVGMSRLWDARAAGREVAENTLKKLNGKKPDFFLLFTTIHYEKHGGFKEFLKGVWEILPEGTPLIGGTVAGFMNPEGCYTRGATALAVNYPNMDVAVGIGHNTKRAPKLAAKECSDTIKKKLKNTHFGKSFSFFVLPGGTIPQFPFVGRKKVMISGLFSKFSLDLLNLSINLFQLGPGREEEVIEELSKQMPGSSILGCSSMDDLKQSICYQFFDKTVHTNDVVGIELSTNLSSEILTKYGLTPTGCKLKITKKGLRNCAIRKIDGKPAVDEFLKRIKWSKDLLDDRLYTRVFYYPLGYTYKGVLRPQIIGAFVGQDIACGYSIKTDEIEVLAASGRSLLNAMVEGIKEASNVKPKLMIGVACATQLETLGKNIFRVYEEFKESSKETPFFIIYCAGEESYTPTSPPKQLYDSFNIGLLMD